MQRQAGPPQPGNNRPMQPPATPPQQPPSPSSPTPHGHSPPIGFFTGRAALSLKSEGDTLPDAAPAFNPHRPTAIPRSAGIDHTKSSPITRKMLQPTSTTDFVNPSLTPGRQIGMPRTPGRSAFKAPAMAAGVKRPPPAAENG
jgi:hypothetical protein